MSTLAATTDRGQTAAPAGDRSDNGDAGACGAWRGLQVSPGCPRRPVRSGVIAHCTLSVAESIRAALRQGEYMEERD